MAKDRYGYLKGFEVAGTDQKFYFANAWADGNDVVVSAEGVPNPVAAAKAGFIKSTNYICGHPRQFQPCCFS